MSALLQLRELASAGSQAPFDFDAFEARRARARHWHRAAGWSAIGAIGVLAAVPVLALLTRPEPNARVMSQPAAARPAAAEVFLQSPALVDMDRFALTSELEDHIAVLDAEISAARLRPVSPADLKRMESAREQLNSSLQRVNYAHALLDL